MTSELVLRIQTVLRQQLQLQPEQGVLAAVSGGRDSVVLAHLLKASQQKFVIAHVNYGLRGEASNTDAAFVRQLAADLGVPFFEKRLNPLDFQQNLQEKAREARYSWFTELCTEHALAGVMLGHHQQDQAETVLMALLRGRGSRSVQGMQLQKGNRMRPLLGFSSEELTAYAQAQALNWVEDASNRSDAYERNYIRLQVKPLLDARFTQWEALVARQAQQWQLYQALLEAQMPEWKAKVVQERAPHWHQWHLAPLAGLPYADLVLGELARAYALGQQLTEALLALQHLPAGKQLEAGEWLVTRTSTGFDWHQPAAVQSFSVQIVGPGTYQLPSARLEVATGTEFDASWELFDADEMPFPMQIRSWQAGDRLSPLGMTGSKKLSDLFTDAKWSAYQKAAAMVLADEQRIYWVVGLRRSTFALRTAGTRTLLAFKIQHD
jgi:tRNA(Ile)-lysidine synthase